MNIYIDDSERNYAVRTLAAGPMRVRDMINFLTGRRVYLLAQARGMQTAGLSKAQMGQRLIEDIIARGENVELPIELNPPPINNDDTELDLDAPKCPDGPTDVRAMLRWKKADNGEAVTVSYDMDGAPEVEGLTAAEIDSVFGQIASVCGIVFAKKTSGKGDIHILWTDLSARNNVLGFAYQPEKGDSMAAAGDLSGDIFCDNSREWVLWELKIKLLHEIMHAVGCHHTKKPADIMFDRPTAAGNRTLSADDIKQLTNRYGTNNA